MRTNMNMCHLPVSIVALYSLFRMVSCFTYEQDVPDTNGKLFFYVTPLCSDNAKPILFIVPQSSRSCFATIATPFNVTNVRFNNGLSRRFSVDCVEPKWNSLGEIGGQIRSTCELTVYVEYSNDNYLVHPLDIAGNKYTVAVPADFTSWECFIAIFPVRNATNVTVMAEAPTTDYVLIDDSSWTKYDSKYKMMVTLYEFETIYIKCACSLSGVEIISPNAFLVVAGAIPIHPSPRAILIEQLSSETTWGRQFLFPMPTLVNITATLYIFGKNNTAGLFVNTDRVNPSFVSISSFPHILEIEADEYIHVISPNSSVLPMVLMETLNNDRDVRFMYMTLPPVSQCLPRHRFNDDRGNRSMAMSLWGTFGYNYLINSQNLTKTAQVTNFTHDNIYLYTNFESYLSFEIIPKRHTTLFPSVCGIVEIARRKQYHLYSLGMRQTNVFDSCVISGKLTFTAADGNDNDCDGLVDEELRNKRDDDGDGLIDEDVGSWTNVRRQVDGEEALVMEGALVAVIISIVVALFAVIAFIGGMVVADQLLGGNSVAPVLDSPDLQ
ncbi:uncharacterized protein LOC110458174 [Mizuhopecten yessoensis]|uniref:IgGFc-binding protein N-terminal domain-containing protein n=1 Tax=Mizuhopecten yessoensis TaxID=6573 RepID=A0A210Q7B4_MIZYE|nr:uncharacterized protein LOC110458174 [Mizuhopecten yessoensis]OWF44579.1 hypothetical protein KP79_PYT17910 [Mizuhopecten yessoensis]